MENCFSGKQSRKFSRKLRKRQNTLEKETGIRCSGVPTKNIAICNAGLVNGLCEEIIYENFSKYGVLEDIVMLPGKSCCFVIFSDSISAGNAFENINAKLKIAQDLKPVFLSYVEEVPRKEAEFGRELPPGLILIEDFVTDSEEENLMSLQNFETQTGVMKHRLVKHFGFEFRYDINNVDKRCPLEEKIPQECGFLWERLRSLKKIDFFEPDQLTVNFYQPGQGIPAHVDTHSAFEDPLFSLSLGGSVVMDFRSGNKHQRVLLPPKSLLIMSGEARFNWTHGITPRKTDLIPSKTGLTVIQRKTRMSYTFRKVRKGECDCVFTSNCDSFKKKQENRIKNEVAADLEKTHVQEVYENIASHFSETRHKPWPNVVEFLQNFDAGSILVDVGCGNGKYLGVNSAIFDLGCDSSHALNQLCRRRQFEVFTCNCLQIPLLDGSADGVISIAVIHHLANEERRIQSIKEITRIMRTNAKALIYVWAKDQQKDDNKTSYLKQDRKNRKPVPQFVDNSSSDDVVTIGEEVSLPVHKNRTQFKHQDVLVPWKLKKEESCEETNFLRFYHVFEEGELEKLCLESKCVKIVKSYYDQGNWCVVLEKI